jgi:glycosyltransferase involved in cell wall biosynthesis
MKIAEITTYKEGGAYTHVVELVKELNEDTLIVTGNTKKTGYQDEDGYKYYHVPRVKSLWEVFFVNHPGAYKELEGIFLKEKIDIVHFHSPLFTFIHGFLKKSKIPTIMTCHYLLEIKANAFSANIYKRFIRRMTKYIGRNIDKIICVNEDYIPVFEEWGIPSNKLVFIPNGVDIKRFSPGKSKARKKFKNKKIILYFGRLHYQKNVELLVRSFPLVKDKIKDVKLIIVGTGNQYDKLKRMSDNDPDIVMTGFVSDEELVDYMRAADVVVFPSRGENASFTIMEAMACELPVVSSDVGNAKKILGDDRGILLKDYTEKEIADICIRVISDEKLQKKIGKDARDYVVKHHSWDKISEQTEEIYQKIIDKKKSK